MTAPISPSEFHRIRRLPPYVFAEVNRLKATARAAGKDIIDLGMGNPDSPTPPHIVDKLVETVRTARRTATRPRAASRVCARPGPPTTTAASASASTRRPRSA